MTVLTLISTHLAVGSNVRAVPTGMTHQSVRFWREILYCLFVFKYGVKGYGFSLYQM